jgi:hypothetical protein
MTPPRPRREAFGALLDQLVHRELEVARHGRNLAANSLAGTHEQGQDELRRFEAGFADQAAQRLAGAQPAHAMHRERHTRIVARAGAASIRRQKADANG